MSGAAPDDVPLVRVKPVGSELRRLVIEGATRSLTFRQLLADLHTTNVVVIIQYGQCARGRVRSCVSHVEGDARQRHIAIKVDTRTTDDRLIATIAHELHHAWEIASRPEVQSPEGALALYRQIAIGQCREGLSERCETDAALAVEARVNDELTAIASPKGL